MEKRWSQHNRSGAGSKHRGCAQQHMERRQSLHVCARTVTWQSTEIYDWDHLSWSRSWRVRGRLREIVCRTRAVDWDRPPVEAVHECQRLPILFRDTLTPTAELSMSEPVVSVWRWEGTAHPKRDALVNATLCSKVSMTSPDQRGLRDMSVRVSKSTPCCWWMSF